LSSTMGRAVNAESMLAGRQGAKSSHPALGSYALMLRVV
jgi:hypothetical protein